MATLRTAGYGDLYPVTTTGKLVTFLILIIGLGVVAVSAGLLASALSDAHRSASHKGDMPKAKRFRPRHFGTDESHLFKFVTMSMVYWDLAEELRRVASRELEEYLYSRFVIPALIMYCSAVEAFINEQLALREGQAEDKEITRLKGENLGEKIKPAFALFANGQETLDENVFQNFIALIKLRNEFIHYKPDWNADLFDWPVRLREALKRSKQEPVAPDWTINFNTKQVLDWAEESTRAILCEFLRVTRQDEKRFFNV